MRAQRLKKFCWWLAACSAALALAACGGGGGDSGTPAPANPSATAYALTSLVSDDNSATNPLRGAHADTHLVNGWGVAFNPAAFVWVSNAGSSTSTLYDGTGVPQSLVVAIPPGTAGPARPTGIVFNGNPTFKVTQNTVSGNSIFIFAGEAGTISGWSPSVNGTNAVTVVDDAASQAVYTGLAIATRGTSDFLYAADFHNGAVKVFDQNFARVTSAGFSDPTLPAGYAPYGIQTIGSLIYVAYARQDVAARNAVGGAGLGIVDTFDTAGTLVKRLISSGGALNAPWGMAMAPANFGQFSNALLVANAGDGKINAFDAATGALLGTLSGAGGTAIAIDGLHGIAFGNDRNSQPSNTLFFAAGPSGENHGVYGRIDSP